MRKLLWIVLAGVALTGMTLESRMYSRNALSKKSDPVLTAPAIASSNEQPQLQSSRVDALTCSGTEYCCPSDTPWYCGYHRNRRVSNKCFKAATDEDLSDLQENCTVLVRCQGAC